MRGSTLLMVMFLAIPASPYLGSWGYPILLLAMTISGFCRSYNFVPTLIVNTEFDTAGKDAFKINIWQSFDLYGDIISYVASGLMMKTFGWSWKTCILVNMACFSLVALSFYLTADEVNMKKQNTEEDKSKVSLFEAAEEIK